MQPGRIVLLDHEAPLFRRRHLGLAAGLGGLFEIALFPVGGETSQGHDQPSQQWPWRCRTASTRNQNPQWPLKVPEIPLTRHPPEIVMAVRAYWKGSLKLSPGQEGDPLGRLAL